MPTLFGKLIRVWRTRGTRLLFLACWNRLACVLYLVFLRRRDRRMIRQILREATSGKTLIIRSTVDWGFPYKQRPQHLAAAFARQGYSVFYHSPQKAYDRFGRIAEINDRLFLIREVESVMDALPGVRILLLSTDNTVDLKLIDWLRQRDATIIYDFIDEIDESISQGPIPHLHRLAHEELLASPDIVCLSSARALHELVLAKRTKNAYLVTNGVALEDFEGCPSRSGLTRSFLRLIDQGKPVAGYYGALAEWLDFELVADVAASMPDINFVLIGPQYDSSSQAWHTRSSNLHVLLPLEYHALIRHAKHFTVCMMPFRINRITEATSPLKLFEYMALGKPIVSTAIHEACRYNSVLTSSGASQFQQAIRRSLDLTADEDYLRLVKRDAEANSWDAKVSQLCRDSVL